MACKAVPGHCQRIHLTFQFHELIMVGNLFGVAGQTIGGRPGIEGPGNRPSDHRTVKDRTADMGHLLRLLVAIHAELVVGPFQARRPRIL